MLILENYFQISFTKASREGNGNPVQYSSLENPPGQRSLVGYNPWGRKESDTAEQLNTTDKGSWNHPPHGYQGIQFLPKKAFSSITGS